MGRWRSKIAEYNNFKALTDTVARQRYFRTRLWKSALMLGGGSLFGLLAVGRLDALQTVPHEFSRNLGYFGAAFPFGMLVLMALAIIDQERSRARCKARGRPKPFYVGDVQALLPWNNAERFWLTLISVNAGLSEELFFRLLVPLLLLIITKQAGFALAVSCVLFGLGHAYQGRPGVLGTTAAAILLTVVYISSGSIWFAAAWHAANNLTCVIVRPLLAAGVRRALAVVADLLRW
jgi:membrane protease YdiL (CAAX protease family)